MSARSYAREPTNSDYIEWRGHRGDASLNRSILAARSDAGQSCPFREAWICSIGHSSLPPLNLQNPPILTGFLGDETESEFIILRRFHVVSQHFNIHRQSRERIRFGFTGKGGVVSDGTHRPSLKLRYPDRHRLQRRSRHLNAYAESAPSPVARISQ